MSKELIERLRSNFPTTQAQFEAADRIWQLEAERDELKAKIQDFLCAWDNCRSSGEWPVRRLEELRAAIAKVRKP